MCQIIAATIKTNKYQQFINTFLNDIASSLEEKGGEYFRCVLIYQDTSDLNSTRVRIMSESTDIETFRAQMIEGSSISKIHVSNYGSRVGVMFFSRQSPEMEIESMDYGTHTFRQPIIKDNISPSDCNYSLVSVHGTISNDKELVTSLNLPIPISTMIDSDIFGFMAINDKRIKGAYVAIEITKNIEINVCNSGLGYWGTKIILGQEVIGELVQTSYITDNQYNTDPSRVFELQKPPPPPSPNLTRSDNGNENLFVSFSGGMDCTLSLIKQLSLKNYKSIYLFYFNHNLNPTLTTKRELESIGKVRDYLYTNFKIKTNLVEIKKTFEAHEVEYESGSESGEKQTESPLMYVPYRNTFFAIHLSSLYEKYKLNGVDILFGLNLTEGMVFLDNSESWLRSIEQTVRYGGQYFDTTKNINIIAPYFNKTKTNMLKSFRHDLGDTVYKEVINLTTSCYFINESNEECGECGSCLLRKHSSMRSEDIKEVKLN